MLLGASYTAKTMSERRDQTENMTPAEEDSRLFVKDVVEVELELTPLRRMSSRSDLVIAGFISGSEIEVVFAGRRRAAVAPLTATLDRLSRGAKLVNTETQLHNDIRCAVRAQGCWRKSVVEEAKGLIERRHQFLVARWSFSGSDGTEKTYGEAPINRRQIPISKRYM